jgi:hypothetical protein
MRYLTMFGMLVLTAVLWSPGTCAAQIPGGSYQLTCRNIGTQGSTLYATCDDGQGGWHSTRLRGYQRCNGEIQNIYGGLQCTGGNQGYNGGYDEGYYSGPQGSYAQTCQNISISGNTLRATCQDGYGGWRQTSIRNYNQCRDIVNNNGRLQCAR